MSADLGHISRVAIFCPVAVTGGPEALHQLSHALNRHGVDSWLLYYGPHNRINIDPDKITQSAPHSDWLATAYAQYLPRIAAEVPRDENTLVVFPEIKASLHSLTPKTPTAIWWLSIDYALEADPKLQDPSVRRELFARPDLIHFYQSAYAREFLRREGAKNLVELRDYTSPIFTDTVVNEPPANGGCAYNVAKGGSLGADFFEANPDLDGLALRGFKRAEMPAVFSKRRVYVDFGHFPGQDRMPREAAACGAISFIRHKGAAAFEEDFPLPDVFKFEDEDIASGVLAARVRDALAAPDRYWPLQKQFRDMIYGESAAFDRRVKTLFRR